MSTSAYIAIKHNGKYRFIKNWNDSYLSELGTVLYRCYNTARRVNALIDLGNTYVVGKHLDNSVSTLREWINLPISESCTASVYRDISRWDNGKTINHKRLMIFKKYQS